MTTAPQYLSDYLGHNDAIPAIDIHRVLVVASKIEEIGRMLKKSKRNSGVGSRFGPRKTGRRREDLHRTGRASSRKGLYRRTEDQAAAHNGEHDLSQPLRRRI